MSFTYVWTDHKTNKLYVGVHKGETSDGYISSGKLFLSEYNSRPEDFTRQIISQGDYDDMISLETTILKSVNAAKDPLFYNGHNGDGNFYNKGHTEKTKTKLKAARNKRIDKPRLGKPLNAEGKLKASTSAKARTKTVEGKQNLSNAGKISAIKRRERMINDPIYAEAYREKIRQSWIKRRMKKES